VNSLLSLDQFPVTPWGVYSVWRRHAKVYQKTWLMNFLSPVAEPLFYLLSFGYGLTPLISNLVYEGRPVTYLRFIAPAMISLGLVLQPFFEGAYGTFIRVNFQKTWQANLTAPLSFAEIFIGDWIWAATKGMLVSTATALVTIALGIFPWQDLLFLLPIMMLGSLTFAALGMLTASIVRVADQVNFPVFLFIVPMCTLSGTYFPRTILPEQARGVAAALPLASVVDLMRWSIAVPSLWWLQLMWLIALAAGLATIAARLIYAKIVR
jgi:lipooligosaccharide transport system permease protein